MKVEKVNFVDAFSSSFRGVLDANIIGWKNQNLSKWGKISI